MESGVETGTGVAVTVGVSATTWVAIGVGGCTAGGNSAVGIEGLVKAGTSSTTGEACWTGLIG